MMEMLTYSNSDLSFINNDFPFPFLKQYHDYYRSLGINHCVFKKNDLLIPALIIKSKIVTLLQFHFAPVHLNLKAVSHDAEKEFTDELIKYIKSEKIADRIIQPSNYTMFSYAPQGSRYAPFGTYFIQLDKRSEEELLSSMQARYRTAVRQIENMNPEIRTGVSELQHFHKLHKETMSRTDSHYEDLRLLDLFSASFDKNVLIANIYIDGVIQGGVYIVHTKYGAYYLHGASAHTTEASGAIKYLHYYAMCALKKQGVALYDFVGARLSDVSGTKLEGIQNFKKRFGSELKAGVIWKMDINPSKCKIYDSLLSLKLKIKGKPFPKDIIEQELEKN